MKAKTAAHDGHYGLREGRQFAGIDDLARWLRSKEIDITAWGSRAHKSIEDLWREIRLGESYMHEAAPFRSLHVTQVIIRDGERILIEAEQEFKRGGKRRRGRPPAEKMRPGETVTAATIRCLQEELSVEVERVTLRPESYWRSVVEGDPQSYPGLLTRWHFHRIEVHVTGLPGHDFVTEESAGNPDDPINCHYWVWRPVRPTID